MLSSSQSAVNTPFPHELWLTLTNELAGVQDAHFLCATIAAEVAAFAGCITVVGLSAPQHEHFDVWIGRPDRQLEQQRWPASKSSFQPFLDAGQAVRLEKLSQPVSELVNGQLWLLPQDSVLGVPFPMPISETLMAPPGALCLVDPGAQCPLDERSLADLARNLTINLDRAYLRRQVDRQDVEFGVVSEIANMLTSTLNLEDVFQKLSGTVRRTLQVESLSVGLIEEPSGDIVFGEALLGSLPNRLSEIRVKRGQGIGGWVAEHGEPIIVNDAYGDKRFYRGADRLSGFRTRSMICIPLQVEGHTIGVLQAINRQYGEFTKHDLRLLQAIAGPLAAAIENANLHGTVVAEKRRVETMFAGMSEGMLTATVEGQITRANDALGALLLSPIDKLPGAIISEAIRLQEGGLEEFVAEVAAVEGEHQQMVGSLMQSGGTLVPVLVSGAPVRGDHNQANEIILTFSDLSQIREVERMRDDLFQAIAHELRTPLATILMYARLLREGKARDEEKAARFLGVIERESDRLQKMVGRMMQLARQHSPELQRSAQPVDLNALLSDLLPPLADQATEKGLLFSQRIEHDLPRVLGDPDRLSEVISNLVVNAIKYSPSGSVSISARKDGDRVVIRVADEGIGIPQRALPNLFKRFYRAETAVERGIAGSGLGLYMVKRTVEDYNGIIEATSKEGEGSAFTVTFPALQD